MGGLQVLALLFLFVLLLLFQPLLALLDAHELDPPLLTTQNHWGTTEGERNRQRNPGKAGTHSVLFKSFKNSMFTFSRSLFCSVIRQIERVSVLSLSLLTYSEWVNVLVLFSRSPSAGCVCKTHPVP